MKKTLALICLVFLSSSLFSQEALVETSLVINIEVPVRVFKDGLFVDNLTIKDFEVFEDGISQKIEAVYLINKDNIKRKDEKKKFRPQTERTFFLFFEISEYNVKMGEAVDYFIQNVLLPSDKLIVITPMKTYRLIDKGLEIKPKEEIAKELKSLIRKDAITGDSEYRSALKDLQDLVKVISAKLIVGSEEVKRILGQSHGIGGLMGLDIEVLLMTYMAYLQKLEVLRKVDELKLLDFAKYLKAREGQNYVFLFYQREFIPQIDQKIWIQVSGLFQDVGGLDISHMVADSIDWYGRDVTIDVERVKQAYADASSSIHFLFVTRPREHIPGVYFGERSSDVFAPFMEMAKASGGFMESSANPNYLFKKALDASENYYLLYYAPKDYAGDGKFKQIKVRVKNKGYKVIHRLGYFAD